MKRNFFIRTIVFLIIVSVTNLFADSLGSIIYKSKEIKNPKVALNIKTDYKYEPKRSFGNNELIFGGYYNLYLEFNNINTFTIESIKIDALNLYFNSQIEVIDEYTLKILIDKDNFYDLKALFSVKPKDIIITNKEFGFFRVKNVVYHEKTFDKAVYDFHKSEKQFEYEYREEQTLKEIEESKFQNKIKKIFK